jgi:hypothetical protein
MHKRSARLAADDRVRRGHLFDPLKHERYLC